MKSNEKSDAGSWLALVAYGVVPAVIGLGLAMILAAVAGCKVRPVVEQWVGIDRSRAACVIDGFNRATCVAAGRVYTCVYDAETWACGGESIAGAAETAPR